MEHALTSPQPQLGHKSDPAGTALLKCMCAAVACRRQRLPTRLRHIAEHRWCEASAQQMKGASTSASGHSRQGFCVILVLTSMARMPRTTSLFAICAPHRPRQLGTFLRQRRQWQTVASVQPMCGVAHGGAAAAAALQM